MKRRIERNERTNRNQRMLREGYSNRKSFDDNAIILSNVRDNKLVDDDVVVYYFSVDKDHDFYVIDYDIRISDYDEDVIKQNVVEAVSDYVWNNIDEFNVLTGDDFTEEEWEEYNEDGVGDIANYRILWTSDDDAILCDEIYCSGYADENDIANDDVIEQVKRKYKRMNGLRESRQFRRNRRMLKESKELRLIESIEVDGNNFSEIGYFGEGKWVDAKRFEEKTKDGWRLPTIEEAKEMIKKCYNEMKLLCNHKYFWIWLEKTIDGRKIAYSMNTEFDVDPVYSGNETLYAFLIR